MSDARIREWAVLLAGRANKADWPMSPEAFEPFVMSIAAEAKGWRDAEPEPEVTR